MVASPSFLSRLGDGALAALAEQWSVRSYRPDELIIEHGDTGRDVFVSLEGRARVTLYSKNGREVLYDVGPCDIFGELAGIDGKARSASIVALEATRAAHLPEVTFRDLVNSHPSFAWALLEQLSALLRRMTNRVYMFSTLVVCKRLILELLRRAEEMEQVDGQVSLCRAPTHFDPAATISTHREAVSREMSTLVKRGPIERRGSRLVFRDLAALETLIARNKSGLIYLGLLGSNAALSRGGWTP
jgi:CRP/FNR family cyclic AMP-dependent transcriptional regulator